MKILKVLGAILGVLVVIVLGVFGYANWEYARKRARTFTPPDFTLSGEMARADAAIGERIAKIRNGCVECHGADLLGGIAIEDPAMGSFYGPNLGPSNLKSWTDEQIARAIRYGIDREGRSLAFMPSHDMVGMSKGDIASLVKYLRGLPEKESARRENSPGPLAKMLGVFGNVPVLFPAFAIDQTRGFGEKPAEGITREFGEYLAVSSCSGCHGETFAGGPIPGGPPDWPAASDLRMSKGGWTEEKFLETMRSGKSAIDGRSLKPPMPVALTAQMSDTELRALWLSLGTK